MSEKRWWYSFGLFHPWTLYPSRPDPIEVLLFYLEKQQIDPKEYQSHLMKWLGVGKSTAYHILHGQGFDLISRCRLLVEALQIPPLLLGIDSKHFPIKEHPLWWQACGYPFQADAKGYPMMHEVVHYLRKQRMHVDAEGKNRVWWLEDLARATGLSLSAVHRMEQSDDNSGILDRMSGRAIVASALGSKENESIIFQLFGLDPQAYRVSVPARQSAAMLFLSLRRPSIPELLQEYHRKLARLFREYHTGHAHDDSAASLQEWTRQFPSLLTLATLTAERISLLMLQSRIHRLLACIACERWETEQVLFHTKRTVSLAEHAMRLSEESRHDAATIDLLAAAVITAATAYHRLGELPSAHKYSDRAVSLLPRVQSRQLKIEILSSAAFIQAADPIPTITTEQSICAYLDQAEQVSLHRIDGPDENGIWNNRGTVVLYRAWCLTYMQSTNEKCLSLLEDAQRWIDPALIRRHIIIAYLQASLHFRAGCYQQATSQAIEALKRSIKIRSCFWRNAIEELYQQLLRTSFRDVPALISLGVRLRTWDYGKEED